MSSFKYEIFNFKAPVEHPNHVRIEPNFTQSGPTDKRLAIARNSEIPLLLKEPGKLTEAEHAAIGYCELKAKPVFVGWPGEESFTAKYYNEAEIKALQNGAVMENLEKLRERAISIGEGSHSNKSAFEMYLAGQTPKTQLKSSGQTSDKPDRRVYTLGFTIPPADANGICMKNVEKTVLDDPGRAAEITQLITKVAVPLLEHAVPANLLAMLNNEADIRSPLTIGAEENRYFTTAQLNYSPVGISLEFTLGEVGGLHADHNDDPRRWTVLLSLDNIPPNHWPGRTLITDLRVYAVMAPLTALVFPGVRPHLSLTPIPMGNSARKPYVPSIPGIADMDSSRFPYVRLKIVCYPKEPIHNYSTEFLKHDDLKSLKLPRGQKDAVRLPVALPQAISHFGSLEHQFNSLARIQAVQMAHMSIRNPDKVLPSAQNIANMYQWRENGVVKTPNVAAIQKVLIGNTPNQYDEQHRKRIAKYGKECNERLSMHSFPRNSKAGEATWVTTSQIGSTIQQLSETLEDAGERPDPAAAPEKRKRVITTKAATKAEFGPRPYKCDFCERRYSKNSTCRAHYKAMHLEERGGVAYEPVNPSRDPGWDGTPFVGIKDESDEEADEAEELPVKKLRVI